MENEADAKCKAGPCPICDGYGEDLDWWDPECDPHRVGPCRPCSGRGRVCLSAPAVHHPGEQWEPAVCSRCGLVPA